MLNSDTIFLFLFSKRATIDARGVRNKFGDKACRRILNAVEDLCHSTFNEAATEMVNFPECLMCDVEVSISQSPDRREWIRIHAVRTLRRKDPDDELFHLYLAKVFSTGESIASILTR